MQTSSLSGKLPQHSPSSPKRILISPLLSLLLKRISKSYSNVPTNNMILIPSYLASQRMRCTPCTLDLDELSDYRLINLSVIS